MTSVTTFTKNGAPRIKNNLLRECQLKGVLTESVIHLSANIEAINSIRLMKFSDRNMMRIFLDLSLKIDQVVNNGGPISRSVIMGSHIIQLGSA